MQRLQAPLSDVTVHHMMATARPSRGVLWASLCSTATAHCCVGRLQSDVPHIHVQEEEIPSLSGGGDWHMAYLLLYRAQHA